MNLFFGKISKKIDPQQIEEGYYISPKGSSWFGDLKIGDYVYLIGGDKIQLWKAREWGTMNNQECLIFEILNNNLGISVSQFIVLKFLKITKSLAVLTSRSARNKAFFKLDITHEVKLEDIVRPEFYKNQELYRKIKIIEPKDAVLTSQDIQLTYENNKLQLVDNDFIEENIKKDFVDNLGKKGRGARMKDNILDFFSKEIKSLPAVISYKEIGFRSFYDAFFCEYKDNEKYFLVGAFWKGNNPEDLTGTFLKEGVWRNGFEDQLLEEVKAVPVGSNIAIKAAYVRERKISVMKIKARGVVKANPGDGRLLEVEWEEDFVPFEVPIGSYIKDTIKEVTKKKHIDAIWFDNGNTNEPPIEMKNSTSQPNISFPHNQIFYGPPGTGKTYSLQKLIKDLRLSNVVSSSEIDFSDFVEKHTWWQIIALVLNEKTLLTVPEIAKHPLIISKLGSGEKSMLKTRLWSSLQHHTVDNCENVKLVRRIGERVFYKEANSLWKLDDETLFRDNYESMIEEYESLKTQSSAQKRNYIFTTCHQSLSYEDFIEGIKPTINDELLEDEGTGDVSYIIRKGIFYKACEEAAKLAGFINLKECLSASKEARANAFKTAKESGKIYIIFLDEINRCNVSGVFGELITLIETDKRLGEEFEIADIKLPYSQDFFGVPSNLYIIGTMNTADRSVEALDTALRRRFSFVEVMPNHDILDREVEGFNLKNILETINNRVEALLDRDHTIGHSYFIRVNDKASLVHAFKNCIIPLLQEYFYGDYEKINLVLGDGFIKQASGDSIIFAGKKNYGLSIAPKYNFIKLTEDTITDAINQMLN